jgi:transcription elongation factor Elf1
MLRRTKVSDEPKFMQSVDGAFTCPECGHDMSAKAYGGEVIYCPECPHEVGWSQMTVEQRFYFTVLRKMGNRRRPNDEMREIIVELINS